MGRCPDCGQWETFVEETQTVQPTSSGRLSMSSLQAAPVPIDSVDLEQEERILTDINELLDQYVALAYHGLRAQDKEFNITIEKNYDGSIGKINIVPQDISRVFLNIINNACYAANDKKKIAGNSFSPILKVSTHQLDGKVEIIIRDNGNGIPASIKEQIFNPFFTTKPAGEGTGLGLSLSYDIVTKVHGGELKFESEEGKFTEFTITLPKS